jgi:hypothetical protein
MGDRVVAVEEEEVAAEVVEVEVEAAVAVGVEAAVEVAVGVEVAVAVAQVAGLVEVNRQPARAAN